MARNVVDLGFCRVGWANWRARRDGTGWMIEGGKDEAEGLGKH